MTTIFDFVKSIESCYKNNLSLQPKVTYENADGFHYGIFYHTKLDKFIFVDEDNTFTEMEPTLVLYPTTGTTQEDYEYDLSVLDTYPNYDFVGTADDGSCMIFFRQVKR